MDAVIALGPERVLGMVELHGDGSRTETSFQDDGTSYAIHYDPNGALLQYRAL